MSKHHYKVPIDSPTGKELTRFLHQCDRCDNMSHRYVKKMGGQYFYSDTRYFEGGVSYISFPDNHPQDPKMWREVGTQHADGSFSAAREPGYKGPQAEGDTAYYEPNVSKRVDWVEIPNADYRPQDTFDCIYNKHPMERDGKLFLQCVRFEYDEPPGRNGSKPDRLRTASRSVRRAIKAEVQRMTLPVVRVETLLSLLGAAMPDVPSGSPLTTTPTIFAFSDSYFVGCDYECSAEDLEPIAPQMYTMYKSRYERSLREKAS